MGAVFLIVAEECRDHFLRRSDLIAVFRLTSEMGWRQERPVGKVWLAVITCITSLTRVLFLSPSSEA